MENLELEKTNSGVGVFSYVLAYIGSFFLMGIVHAGTILFIRGDIESVRFQILEGFLSLTFCILFLSVVMGLIGVFQTTKKRSLAALGLSISLVFVIIGFVLYLIGIIMGV